MSSMQIQEFINRPHQQVFDYLAGDNDTQWQSQTLSSEWTSPGPVGVGSVKHVVNQSMGRQMEVDVEYTRWDPPHRYSFKTLNTPFPFKAIQGTISLAPMNGGTQMTMDVQVESVGVFRLLEGLMLSQFKKQDASNMKALKRLLEAG